MFSSILLGSCVAVTLSWAQYQPAIQYHENELVPYPVYDRQDGLAPQDVPLAAVAAVAVGGAVALGAGFFDARLERNRLQEKIDDSNVRINTMETQIIVGFSNLSHLYNSVNARVNAMETQVTGGLSCPTHLCSSDNARIVALETQITGGFSSLSQLCSSVNAKSQALVDLLNVVLVSVGTSVTLPPSVTAALTQLNKLVEAASAHGCP